MINLPVGAAMVVLLHRAARSPVRPARFDAAGQVLVVLALTGVVVGVVGRGHRAFCAPVVVGALTVAGLVAFVLARARGRHPMVALSLFGARGFRLALLIRFLLMVGNVGNVIMGSLQQQQQLGLTSLAAGQVFFPSAAFAVAGDLVSGLMADLFGSRPPVRWAGPGDTGRLAVARGSGLDAGGAAGSAAMPVVTEVVLEEVPAERAGTVSAVFDTFGQVGGVVAIAAFRRLLAVPSGLEAGRTNLLVAVGLLTITVPPSGDGQMVASSTQRREGNRGASLSGP